jgi:tRNA modification GTPase
MEYPRDNLTIAAIATPVGTGGLGVVRVSGKDAFDIAGKIFTPNRGQISTYKTHTAHLGTLHQNGHNIDSALITIMRGPKSYTGEDTVEFSCHGGRIILAQALQAAIESGAAPAQPGEFSMRAFLNGKLDLAQAEAVQELICAENELAAKVARGKLDGTLSRDIQVITTGLVDIAAEVEAAIDFVDEDIDPAGNSALYKRLEKLLDSIDQLSQSYDEGRKISTGVNIVIAGKPNVGKSSLMNALLEHERAIVTHVPGTTRDVIIDTLVLKGISINIIDTAGIRTPANEIEQAGIERTSTEIDQADLVAFVVDRSVPIDDLDHEIFNSLQTKNVLIVLNKVDIESAISDEEFKTHFGGLPDANVSALKGTGIDNLKTLLYERAWGTDLPGLGQSIITSARHKRALDTAAESVKQAMNCLETDESPEFTSIDLRAALEALGQITGHNITEEILDAVFSKFCIGK